MDDIKSREQDLAEAKALMGLYGLISLWPHFCTINTSRAMLDEVGLGRAVEATLPCNEAWGRAFCDMVEKKPGPKEIHLVGSQRTIGLVVPRARETGLHLGAMIKGEADGKGDLSMMMKDRLDLLGSYFQQRGSSAIMASSGMKKEIIDCPSKGGSHEVCKQFEAVFGEVCEPINPDYEFSYDRMMSEGDPTCHWVIKNEAASKEVGQQERINDPLNVVQMRLAKGETSKE